jgi:hypothetical protein
MPSSMHTMKKPSPSSGPRKGSSKSLQRPPYHSAVIPGTRNRQSAASHQRNKSCSPVSRRSRGFIVHPSAQTATGAENRGFRFVEIPIHNLQGTNGLRGTTVQTPKIANSHYLRAPIGQVDQGLGISAPTISLLLWSRSKDKVIRKAVAIAITLRLCWNIDV